MNSQVANTCSNTEILDDLGAYQADSHIATGRLEQLHPFRVLQGTAVACIILEHATENGHEGFVFCLLVSFGSSTI